MKRNKNTKRKTKIAEDNQDKTVVKRKVKKKNNKSLAYTIKPSRTSHYQTSKLAVTVNTTTDINNNINPTPSLPFHHTPSLPASLSARLPACSALSPLFISHSCSLLVGSRR